MKPSRLKAGKSLLRETPRETPGNGNERFRETPTNSPDLRRETCRETPGNAFAGEWGKPGALKSTGSRLKIRRGRSMTNSTSTARVNENAIGVWQSRVGEELEVVGAGANTHHLMVKRPGDPERKAFGFPAAWLDEPDDRRAS